MLYYHAPNTPSPHILKISKPRRGDSEISVILATWQSKRISNLAWRFCSQVDSPLFCIDFSKTKPTIEIRHLRLYVDSTCDGKFTHPQFHLILPSQSIVLAQAQHYASDVIDTWHDEIEDVEYEGQLWKAVHFSTDMRDHWSQNGILPCIAEWRQKCDISENSILWISSQSNGRQSWLTEFTLDLIDVCKSQSHTVIAGMCDRPRGVKWTPKRLLRQLIAQLLIDHPILTITQPRVFNSRNFRRASSFTSLAHLLHSSIAVLKSVLIIIDRLDLCVPRQNNEYEDIVQMLSQLVRTYPDKLRVIITTGQLVSPQKFPDFPISFAMVNTRRRPRRRHSPSPSRSPGSGRGLIH